MSFETNSTKYTCTALVGTNKTGTLTPDEDGYYTLVVGALDVFNSVGAFYPLAPGKKLFEESSSFMRRVKEGNCKGEVGHPKPLPGQGQRDYIQRILSIEETNVCCHFKSFWLEEGKVKDEKGRNVIAIMAEIKPAGPNGDALKEALENKHENVCFSIRSFTNDQRTPSGMVQKNLKTIITFDWVTEPGISVAKKYHSPALESMAIEAHIDSLEEVEFTQEHLNSLEEKNKLQGGSMENSVVDLNEIRDELGWSKKQHRTTNPSLEW